uniref:Adenylate cyclase n=1 Tax=Candidatus Kentrum sp. TC TaxID=2126339 RepID=A0A450ZYP3_9GAMM|nr:MAG: adenylate cyclase [Candidatus Kentron sp. TC]
MRRTLLHGILVFSLACGVAFGLDWRNRAELPASSYYDLWHCLAGKRTEPSHTAIVAVDDESLSLFPMTPLVFWGPYFARAIEVLDRVGAKVIGMDFLFSVSVEAWIARFTNDPDQDSRAYDIPLRTQLSKGKTILAGVIGRDNEGHGRLLLPVPDLLYALPNGRADVGLGNMSTNADGVVRRFRPTFSEEGTQPKFGFGVLLALRAAGRNPSSDIEDLGNRTLTAAASPQPIGFVGPPGTIPKVSFARLMEPNALQYREVRALRGKVVIIAADFSGVQDIHPTPYTSGTLFGKGEFMTGAEIHGNIVETLLRDRYPCAPMMILVVLGVLGILCIAVFAYSSLNPWLGLLLGFGLSSLWALGSYLWFLVGWHVPVIGAQAGLFTAYLGCMGFRLVDEKDFSCKVKDLLSRYFGSQVANRFLTCAQSTRLGGERKIVTILFCDIRNFTTIAEHLQPEEVVEILNAYFGDVSRAIEEGGGRIDKFIGDAVMAVFGDPTDERNHAWQAVRTAREIEALSMKFRDRMAKRFIGYDLSDFSVGIGINTGPVVIGNIGAEDRMEYTAIGDTVNVAARIQGICRELGCIILASRATVTEIGKEKLIYGCYRDMSVKGHRESVQIFEVRGLAR